MPHKEITVRVTPRSSKNEVVGMVEGVLKVRLKAPPVDGAANEELRKVLAEEFDVPRSNVEIVSGHASRTKRVRITDKSA